jgi:hypothetical protein
MVQRGLNVSGWFIAIAGISIILYSKIYLPNNEYIDSGQILWDIAKVILIVTMVLVLIFIVIPRAWSFRQNRQHARISLYLNTRDANELLQETHKDKSEREHFLSELQEIAKKLRSTPKFLAEQAAQILPKVENEANRLQKAIEKEKRSAEDKKKSDHDRFVLQANQAYQAFIKQGHTKTIPEAFKNFDHHAIYTAEEWFKDYERENWKVEREKREDEEHRKSALKFVWKHRALPSDYSQMSEERQVHYDEAMALLKSGELKDVIDELREDELEQRRKDYLTDQDYVQLAGSVEAGKEREKELVENDFYFVPELKDAEQNFLLKFHGFKKFKVSDFGERLLPVLYRCSEKNESPNHFCTKHLFARLHPGAKIEAKDWWDNEVDVLFSKGKQKLAVEIERGTNKPADVRDKVSSLCRAKYAKIILVVPRDVLPKYRQYHDGKLVFVSTAKQAKEMILKWLK